MVASSSLAVQGADCCPVIAPAGIGDAQQRAAKRQEARRQAASVSEPYARRKTSLGGASSGFSRQPCAQIVKFRQTAWEERVFPHARMLAGPRGHPIFLLGLLGLDPLSEVRRWLPGTKRASSRMRPLAGKSRSVTLSRAGAEGPPRLLGQAQALCRNGAVRRGSGRRLLLRARSDDADACARHAAGGARLFHPAGRISSPT